MLFRVSELTMFQLDRIGRKQISLLGVGHSVTPISRTSTRINVVARVPVTPARVRLARKRGWRVSI